MSSYKDKNHKGNRPWYVKFYYKNEEGKRVTKIKRGFHTQREADKFEKCFLQDIESEKEYVFESVVEFYLNQKSNQLKESTMQTKKAIIEKYITPYFRGRDIRTITIRELMQWQANELYKKDETGKRVYSDTYIKTINSQLRAIFNFAKRASYIDDNPIENLESVGKKDSDRECVIWTSEEFWRFEEAITDYEDAYLAVMILYYTGLRKGELLALTVGDFNYDRRTLSINKTYSVINGKPIVTEPKTAKSKRVVELPHFLADEIKNYIDLQYKPEESQRIFQHRTGKFIETALEYGCKKIGIPKPRIHDLRHSHITLLGMNMVPPKEIARRVGHSELKMTWHYSHSTDEGQKALIDKLERDGAMYHVS
ncbi:MAG: site-specific integrase [Oscillospiraceae bacterium]|nr:site-specific integrase [Oscillospiraceae bacterium]